MIRTAAIALTAAAFACGPDGFEVVSFGDARDLRSIAVDASGSGWIVGQRGAFHRYTPDGITADTYRFEDGNGTRTPDLFAVAVHRDAAWAAGDDGLIARRLGATTMTEASGSSARGLTLVEVTPSILVAAGEQATVRQRQNDRWRNAGAAVPAGARVTGSWSAGERVVLTTDAGVVVERDPGGRWTAQAVTTETSSTPVPLFDVWSSTVGADLFVVGLGGVVFRRPADETEWQSMPSPATEDLYAIDGGESGVYAVGASGTVVKLEDGAWSREASATGRDLFDVSARGPTVIAVGAGGTVVRN